MKQADINKEFTNKVNGYLAYGWTFNPGTCNASSASDYCMDLTDGKHLVRISITDFHDYENNLHGKDVIARRLLREHEPRIQMNGSRYNWLSDSFFDLPCDQTRFWRLDGDKFGSDAEPYYCNSEDEALEANQKRRERYRRNNARDFRRVRNGSVEREFQDEKTLELAKAYIKRKTGKRSIRKDQIHAFRMVHANDANDNHYQIWYAGTRV